VKDCESGPPFVYTIYRGVNSVKALRTSFFPFRLIFSLRFSSESDTVHNEIILRISPWLDVSSTRQCFLSFLHERLHVYLSAPWCAFLSFVNEYILPFNCRIRLKFSKTCVQTFTLSLSPTTFTCTLGQDL
jgi:hypothetical protein